jgi:hypothetical protein
MPDDPTTLNDEEIETRHGAGSPQAVSDDSDDSAEDAGDDATDTGDDSGDVSDATDTGDDSGDDSAAAV